MEEQNEKMLKLSQHIKEKYPDRIPVIVESKKIILKKYKFIVPNTITVSRFMIELRKNITHEIDQNKNIFIQFKCKGLLKMPLMTDFLENVYQKSDTTDGFLYLYVLEENTFGNLHNQ